MAARDQVAIVTGAAHGIGNACARRFARGGFRVVLADIDDVAGEAARDEILSHGGTAIYVHCDVSKRLDIHNLMAETRDGFGRVDVLVNAASTGERVPFLELEDEAFDRVMSVNLKGAFLASQAVAKAMAKQLETSEKLEEEREMPYSIITISSVMAVMTHAEELAFSVSKGAVNQLTKAMALALASYGIRVNAIGPGSISTESMKPVIADAKARQNVLARTPLGRIGDADEIAAIAFFLASREASYVTGQCIYADGGRLALNATVAPPGAKEG